MLSVKMLNVGYSMEYGNLVKSIGDATAGILPEIFTKIMDSLDLKLPIKKESAP